MIDRTKGDSAFIAKSYFLLRVLCVFAVKNYYQQNSPDAIIWHRNFHESVTRDSSELEARRNYIRDNPGKLGKDNYG